MHNLRGTLVVSLDFELHWGVRDKKAVKAYKRNLLGARSVVPRILEAFQYYEIHATWATVGFLFFDSKAELVEHLPALKPQYACSRLTPYGDISGIGANEEADPFHYALSLIKAIAAHPNQEIATHTFSHYYCMEPGQDLMAFRADIEAAVAIMRKNNLTPESIVFPRNQVNPEYLAVLPEYGITSYRGAPWYCVGREESLISSYIRAAARLLDAYVPIFGHNTCSYGQMQRSMPFNIQSDRMLRPYSRRFRTLEPLRLRRILAAMEFAAKKKRAFHLWWHPHNFGVEQESNLAALERILAHYVRLRESHGMVSRNMRELSRELLKEHSVEPA
ncbi:polysaccharide deacetylase [candidate division Kazan bacterium]|uniref:Polysaccharide deacetylase n=1 Tax=candidate division Kazan bacterium TaxID=2202143 RepID=A0A420ZB35_UNCK3|nr:MAG: polysaccharide deacetylase [candidate division Kazan bacterium]